MEQMKSIFRKLKAIFRLIKRRTVLMHLEFHLADHCNLNCQCCDHFAPIADNYFLDLDEFERDMSRLADDSVGLLSRVELMNMNNNAKMTYTIASPHEANLREGKISIKSPIAQALLNKKVGDVVEVRVPAGLLKLRIESISL